MLTGITNLATELSEKYIELLVEIAPKVKRVGLLIDGNIANPSRLRDAALRSAANYSVEAFFAYAAKAEEIEPAISTLAKQGIQALVMVLNPFLTSQRDRIIGLAQRQRWPIVAGSRRWVEEGALISYGVDERANYRRAAYYVDRILKGVKPGDLPIEQPTTFEVVVNLRAAKALGLTVPPTILVRATHVIQ